MVPAPRIRASTSRWSAITLPRSPRSNLSPRTSPASVSTCSVTASMPLPNAKRSDAKFNQTLKVSTRDPGDAVEFRIRDNGTGIPSEIKDKLFQPFFTTKPTGEGTGLGLSISYDIVTQQHGGSIEVDSRVGDFTEFTVRLPRHRATMAEAAS